MIKILLLITFLVSCSSSSKKDYEKNEIENRADEYSIIADRYRQNKMYQEADEYYVSASDLYLLKGSKQKHLITSLKRAILLLKKEEFEKFMIMMEKIKAFNRIEKLGHENEIIYLESRFHYKKGNLKEGNKLIKLLIEHHKNNLEKYAYYRFFLINMNPSTSNASEKNELTELFNKINELYIDGKLFNIEVLTFSSLVISKIYLNSEDYQSAKKHIEKAEKLYVSLELTSKRGEILKLHIKLHNKQGNKKQEDHYRELLKQFNLVKSRYNN